MAQVVVRYFASARAASGLATEQVEASSVDQVLAAIAERHGARLAAIVQVSTLLVGGVRVSDRSMPLSPGAELEVLPPFAGG